MSFIILNIYLSYLYSAVYFLFIIIYIIQYSYILPLFFFRVVIQNERYEDWAAASLMLLRRLYYTYKIDILNYHHKVLHDSGVSINSIPEAYLSHASQGNFLEVLNMALNGKYIVWFI